MSPSTETIKLLTHNLNTLNFVLAPAQRNAMTDDDRGTVLRTLRATAEAGAKLAEVAHMDAVREMGQKTPAAKDAAALQVAPSWDRGNSSPDTKKPVAGRYRIVPTPEDDGW